MPELSVIVPVYGTPSLLVKVYGARTCALCADPEPLTIFRIFSAIVANVDFASVSTPWSVTADATNSFPSLTD